jgi:hypothetical protein
MIARSAVLVAGVGVCLFLQPASSIAQQTTRGSAWAARMVMEPVVLAHGGFSARCSSQAARLATWGVEQIERAVRTTEGQRPLLNELKTAVTKAADLSNGECPAQIPRNSMERLVFQDKRVAALQRALRTILPAFEALQASLTDEQKVVLDSGPRRWRWSRD